MVQLEPSRWSCLLAAMALVAGGAACGDAGGEPEKGGRAPVPLVEATRAREGALPLEERLSGRTRARNQISVRPEIRAAVESVHVQSGQRVAAGDPLVTLDGAALRAQVARAEADVRLAEAAAAASRARELEVEAAARRTRELAAHGVISSLEGETLEARLAAARASTVEAEARVEASRATGAERRAELAKTRVLAPVAGRVGRRDAEVGMIVDPESVLFVLGDPEDLVVEVPLTQSVLSFLSEGQKALVHPPEGGPIEGTLARISPFVARGTFSTVGEIDVGNAEGRLHAGTFVSVDVLYGQSERATLLPAAALWEDPQSGAPAAFVVAGMDGDAAADRGADASEGPVRRAARRPVEVVAAGRAAVGVRGIAEGEWVVTIGQNLLAAMKEPEARVRPVGWEHVMELQSLQRHDLLRRFLEKQRRQARRGADLPSTAEYLREGGGQGAGSALP